MGRAPRRARSALAFGLLAGCGPDLDCLDPTQELTPDLTCAEADSVVGYLTVLAGRPIDRTYRRATIDSVRAASLSDPEGTRRRVEAAVGAQVRLGQLTGPEAAEARSHLGYEAIVGAGPLAMSGMPVAAPLAVWARDPDQELVLTEADIEGWIRYASLCREAQGGGPLVLSISDRRPVYDLLVQRFRQGDHATRQAMVSVGPFWSDFSARWQAAPSEAQRLWIAEAPLPPPMTATSMAYVEAVLGSDLEGHVRVWHRRWPALALEGADRG